MFTLYDTFVCGNSGWKLTTNLDEIQDNIVSHSVFMFLAKPEQDLTRIVDTPGYYALHVITYIINCN